MAFYNVTDVNLGCQGVVGQFAVAALYERRRCRGINTGGHRPPLQDLKLTHYVLPSSSRSTRELTSRKYGSRKGSLPPSSSTVAEPENPVSLKALRTSLQLISPSPKLTQK